jgi:hypothetical protein
MRRRKFYTVLTPMRLASLRRARFSYTLGLQLPSVLRR